MIVVTKAVAEIPVILLKADVEECMDTSLRQTAVYQVNRVCL